MNRLRAVASVSVVLLAVVASEPGWAPTTLRGASDPSARVTAGPSWLGELVVLTRPAAVGIGWVDPGSAKSRPFPHPAVASAMAGLLVVLLAGLVRHQPGPPWHHWRRHSAVLRAPPLLLRP